MLSECRALATDIRFALVAAPTHSARHVCV